MAYNSSYNNNSYGNRNQNNRNQGMSQNRQQEKKYEPLNEETYVTRAEEVILKLKEQKETLTTSQIRNILSMMNQIYNDVIVTTDEKLSKEVQSQLLYLKVKLIYAAGRNNAVKEFLKESQIDKHLDYIKDSRDAFILYSRYMEALVAYHKFYGGKD